MNRPDHATELEVERGDAIPSHAGATPAAQTGVAGTMSRIQASAGNAAAQRMLSGARLARQVPPPTPAPPVAVPAPPAPAAAPAPGAVTQHTPAEIKALTLEAFDSFAKGQADWALDPGLGADKEPLQGVLEFARAKEGGLSLVLGGCGKMTVQALLGTGLDAAARDDLRLYSRGVMQPAEHPTVRLDATDDIAKARTYGQTLRKLEAVPGGVTIKRIFNQPEALDRLMAATAVDSFISYINAVSPTLQAEDPELTSPEITSFLAFHAAGDEAFIGALPDVLNLHRFQHDALARLQQNLQIPPDQVVADKKPLVLILHSAFDHNGAFHRDPNMTQVIIQADKLVLLVEGKESLAAMQGELAGIAARYGHDGKIHEVMLAGHGEAHFMEMTGKLDAQGQQVGQDVKTKDKASDAFMAELVKNMATGPDTRIVLNACLTASNKVETRTDPKTGKPKKLSSDPDKAAKEVQAAIATDPSLKDSIAKVATGVQVRGSNASFGQVGLLDSSGHLDVVSAVDPQLTAPKADYALNGNEPQGVMRALLEVWAADRVVTPHTTVARGIVDTRKNDTSTAWRPRIIGALHRAIDRQFDNAELMRRLAEAAGALSDLVETKQPSTLNTLPAAVADAVYTDLTAADDWKSEPKLPLLAYQHWLRVSPTQGANFKSQLVGNFTCKTAKDYDKMWYLAPAMGGLLPAGTPAPARADLELALLGVISDDGVDVESRRFLKQVAGTSAHFDPSLHIDEILDTASLQSAIETTIGLKGGASVATTASGAPNTDLDGDGTPDVYIESMDRKTAQTRRATYLRSRPAERGDLVTTLQSHARLIVVGKSGDHFVVENGTAPQFVLQRDVNLGEVPNVDIDGDGVNDFHVESLTRRAAVTATHLNVRMFPGMQEKIVASLEKGVEVMVDGMSGDWFAIEHGGSTRFVHQDWLDIKPVA